MGRGVRRLSISLTTSKACKSAIRTKKLGTPAKKLSACQVREQISVRIDQRSIENKRKTPENENVGRHRNSGQWLAGLRGNQRFMAGACCLPSGFLQFSASSYKLVHRIILYNIISITLILHLPSLLFHYIDSLFQ